MYNILDLYATSGFEAKATSSQEYAGPCPFCDDYGVDRFLITLNKGEAGLFYCRKCGRGGSAKTLMYYLSLQKAGQPVPLKDKLPTTSTDQISFARPKANAALQNPAPLPYTDYEKTVARAHIFINTQYFLNYLKGRGIGEEAARHFKLGLIVQGNAFYPVGPDNLKLKYLPLGLCIPNYRHGNLCSVKVRIFSRDADRKYECLKGCRQIPFIAIGSNNSSLPVIIVESELDAILLWQELGEMFHAYIALGSAGTSPNDAYVNEILINTSRVYFVADNDTAGMKAYTTWKQRYDKIQLILLPIGKDPTEAWLAGFDLKEWGKLLRRGRNISDVTVVAQATPEVPLTSHIDLQNYLVLRSSNCSSEFIL